MGVVHLDVRSYFSLREGAFSPEDLATRAAELGMPAVALVDRDSLMGATRFVDACARAGVRPILGASVTMADGSSTILLARDDEGYANLCRIVTDAHAVPERGRPSLEVAQVCAHPRGLDCLLGVRSTAGRHARAGRARAARDAAAPYRDAFGDRLSIAVEHRLERDSPTEVRAMLATRSSPTRSPACASSRRSMRATSDGSTPRAG